MKKIYIKFSNDETWSVPIDIIAEDRAYYYAMKKDGFEKGSTEWDDEVQNGLNDIYELEDWVINNMSWDQLKPHVTLEDNYEEYDYASNLYSAEFIIK